MAIESLTKMLSQFVSNRSNLVGTVTEDANGVDFSALMDDLSIYLEDSTTDVNEVLKSFEGIPPAIHDIEFEIDELDLKHALASVINKDIPDITNTQEQAMSVISDLEEVEHIAAFIGNILPPEEYLSADGRSEKLLSNAKFSENNIYTTELATNLDAEQKKFNFDTETIADKLGSNEQQKLTHEGQQKIILGVPDNRSGAESPNVGVELPKASMELPKVSVELPKIVVEPPIVNNSLANVQTAVTSKESVPPMDRQLGQMGWSQDLTERILWMANKSIKAAEIRINPPQLGPLEIRINMNQDQANIYFSSQHAVVREAIESAIPKLREMFGNQQLNVLDVDVSDQSFAEQREHTDNTRSQNQEPAMDSILGDQELETISETTIETNVITEGSLSFYV